MAKLALKKTATLITAIVIGLLLVYTGSVHAQSGSISAGNAEGDRSQTIQVSININNGSSVGAFGCDVGWDSSVLTYVGTDKGGLVPAGWTFLTNPAGSSVRIGGYGVPDINGSGAIAVISFQIKPTAVYGNSTITISGVTDGLSAGGNGTVPVQAGVNIESFEADPETIAQGESSILRWTISNATSASISNGVGNVNKVSGSAQVSPAQTTTYTLTAQGPGGTRTATAKVTVTKVPKPTIESFTVDKPTAVKDDTITFSFKIKDAKSASIDNGVGSVSKNGGTARTTVNKDTIFTLTAKNAGGTSTASVSVTVIAEPIIHWFTSSTSEDQPINSNESAYLGWSVFGAESVSINRGIGDVDEESGILLVSPEKTTTYELTAQNKAGTSTAEVTVHVTDVPRIASFRAAPPSVLPGQSTNINWSVIGADSITIDPAIGQVFRKAGSESYTPEETMDFTLAATNGGGSAAKTITVNVVSEPPDLHVNLEKLSKKRLGLSPAERGTLLGNGTVGEPIEIVAKVENLGSGDAQPCLLRLAENGVVLVDEMLDKLEPGESQKVTFEYVPLHTGESLVEIIADPENSVPEYDKENNIVSGIFEAEGVKGIDLVISNVSISEPVLPGSKNILSVSFTITNVGTVNSGEFDYSAYITRKLKAITEKDDVVIKGSISNLLPGESIGVDKTVILKKVPNKFYFRGFVDADHVVIEINEDNNTLEKQFNRNEL